MKYLLKLGFIPKGLTLAAGWGMLFQSTAVPFACVIGHPIPGIPCPTNPVGEFLLALVSIGLGRRG